MVLPCKNKEERGSARASPVAAPMPKSISLLREKKESLDCLVLTSVCVSVRVRTFDRWGGHVFIVDV